MESVISYLAVTSSHNKTHYVYIFCIIIYLFQDDYEEERETNMSAVLAAMQTFSSDPVVNVESSYQRPIMISLLVLGGSWPERGHL